MRHERAAAPLAGSDQVQQRAFFGIYRIARIDVVGPRPGRSGMHMHLVEFAIVIDICPSLESPFDGLGFLAVLLVKALRCAVRDREYMANEAPAGIAAEIELPGFGMPAAVVRLDNPRI